MPKIRILIADDHPVVCAGLRILLERQRDMIVVDAVPTMDAAQIRLASGGVDVIVLDLGMPGGGLPGVRAALAQEVRVLVLTMHDSRMYIDAALDAGATGYVTKRAGTDELVAAIRAVARGKTYVEAGLDYRRARRAAPPPIQVLSPRERQVLGMIARGYTNREIAELLDISVKTIEGYRARVLAKLGARTRAELVEYAMLVGLLPSNPLAAREDD